MVLVPGCVDWVAQENSFYNPRFPRQLDNADTIVDQTEFLDVLARALTRLNVNPLVSEGATTFERRGQSQRQV